MRRAAFMGFFALGLLACDSPDQRSQSASEPDACDARRVSASRPCAPDPDPCGLDSGFAGDEYCLLPPPSGEGIQMHFGPKSYTDSDEIAKYVIRPSEEFNAYGIAHIPTTEDHWFNHVEIRMRPGSHHLINTVVEGQPEEGFVDPTQGCPGAVLSGFPGTQNLVYDSPPKGVPAPENVGLGSRLPGNASICHNYHSYNFGDEDQLREVWMNVWFVDESEVTQRASSIFVLAGPKEAIEPHSQEVITATTAVSGTGRIVSMFGHRHAWTDRFAVWKNEELVYDSWNWEESVVFNYDSLTENPPPNPDAKTDGAVTGVLDVDTGDQLRIECDVNNTSDKTLTFSNALYDGEMCILFGSSVGVAIR